MSIDSKLLANVTNLTPHLKSQISLLLLELRALLGFQMCCQQRVDDKIAVN